MLKASLASLFGGMVTCSGCARKIKPLMLRSMLRGRPALGFLMALPMHAFAVRLVMRLAGSAVQRRMGWCGKLGPVTTSCCKL